MEVKATALEGVLIVEPKVFRDERGFFCEVYHAARYAEAGIEAVFVQDNHTRSRRGVLRGLHAQRRHPQAKLVRASAGVIFDVAVDIRPSSSTYRRWVGVELSAENFRQLFIPPGYAHGFCALSDIVEVQYKCAALYDPTDELAIRWDDPEIGIEWPISTPQLSERDARAPRLHELE